MSQLLDPIQIGSLFAPNGLVLAPMTTYSSLPDGSISPDELPYLARRAAGGLGIVMTAACYISDAGKAFQGQWGCAGDHHMPSLIAVAEAIHSGGALAILQIHHGGRQSPPTIGACVAPSAIAYPRDGAPTPREMTSEEIEQTVNDFALAAKRAKQAGFDGVEIHGANTYLIQQFVSPASNIRQDHWGTAGLKFPVAVANAVRLAVGPDFCVGYRFSPEEPEAGGLTVHHTFALIDALCDCDLNFLHISLRSFDQPSLQDPGSSPVMSLIASHIGGRLPLIGVGSVKSRDDVMRAEAMGADLLAIGRAAISDPEIGHHLAAGSQVITTIGRADYDSGQFAAKLTLPAGLASKIASVPGWFEIESDSDPVE